VGGGGISGPLLFGNNRLEKIEKQYDPGRKETMGYYTHVFPCQQSSNISLYTKKTKNKKQM